MRLLGLSLRWESGLKYDRNKFPQDWNESLPSLGEWIEIVSDRCGSCRMPSLPSLGEWIEILYAFPGIIHIMSLPSLGEWIEMMI